MENNDVYGKPVALVSQLTHAEMAQFVYSFQPFADVIRKQLDIHFYPSQKILCDYFNNCASLQDILYLAANHARTLAPIAAEIQKFRLLIDAPHIIPFIQQSRQFNNFWVNEQIDKLKNTPDGLYAFLPYDLVHMVYAARYPDFRIFYSEFITDDQLAKIFFNMTDIQRSILKENIDYHGAKYYNAIISQTMRAEDWPEALADRGTRDYLHSTARGFHITGTIREYISKPRPDLLDRAIFYTDYSGDVSFFKSFQQLISGGKMERADYFNIYRTPIFHEMGNRL
jgi:hypothetical protein